MKASPRPRRLAAPPRRPAHTGDRGRLHHRRRQGSGRPGCRDHETGRRTGRRHGRRPGRPGHRGGRPSGQTVTVPGPIGGHRAGRGHPATGRGRSAVARRGTDRDGQALRAGRNGDRPGPAGRGKGAHQAAGWLADRDPGSLLDEVRSFARRKPGTYLAIAMGAGVLAGRLTRGLTAPTDEATAGTPSSSPRRTVGRDADRTGAVRWQRTDPGRPGLRPDRTRPRQIRRTPARRRSGPTGGAGRPAR